MTTAKRNPPVRTSRAYFARVTTPARPRARLRSYSDPHDRRAPLCTHQEVPEMTRYAGKVAVVTGSARGIGAATAARFASEGAAVAVLDLDQDAAATTAANLGAEKAMGVACNVGEAESVSAAVARVIEELGTIDVLVNNAGVTRDNLLFKMTEEDWDAVL